MIKKYRRKYIGYNVTLRPTKGRRYVVQFPYEIYNAELGMYFKIPGGFKTNGANVPRIFWSLIEPNQSDIMPAVIAHDYLCEMAVLRVNTFKQADKFLLHNLVYLGCNKIKAKTIYYSCRLYHILRYGYNA